MYYSFSDYDFIKFEKSRIIDKKYDAILKNKRTNRTVRIPFGAIDYEQYNDTALQIYKRLNHFDTVRRNAYIKRHKGFIRDGYYSPGFFSMQYLWS